MTSYDRQKDTIERLKKKHEWVTPILIDVIETIGRAEQLETWIKRIYDVARKEREICKHCDSVAKLIEELTK